jgi:hypothetical protein
MVLSGSRSNVSLFTPKVSATNCLFALEREPRIALFLRRHDYVFAPLHLAEDSAGVSHLAADNDSGTAGSRRGSVRATIATAATHGGTATCVIAGAQVSTRPTTRYGQSAADTIGIRA